MTQNLVIDPKIFYHKSVFGGDGCPASTEFCLAFSNVLFYVIFSGQVHPSNKNEGSKSYMTPKQFVAKWSQIQQKDTAVLDAYGWPHSLSDEEILEHLLALNLERAAAQGKSQ